MQENASQRLLRRSDDIMARWEQRAQDEVLSALKLESLALRNSLPELLKLIAHVLSTTSSRSEARQKWEKDEALRVGRKHGQERAATQQYTISQMIFEYHILRQVICDVMEEDDLPLTPVDREVIVCAIEQAVNDASSQFSDTVKEAQERLSTTLTHDLKGPLTVASLATQRLLRRSHDPAYCLKAAKSIMSSIERLTCMVQTLLDVSRLNFGKNLALSVTGFDIDNLVQELTADLDIVYDGRMLVRNHIQGRVYWDKGEIYRLIENLTNNAAKYGREGTPITLDLSETQDHIICSVHNEGTPIAPDQHANLFRQFHRGSSARQQKGWGIGLTVVKGIVEAHHGHVSIESSAELGTSFIIKLPRDARSQA